MLEALGEIVRNVAVILLFTTFLDMLLPNSNMQNFIKVIMGLFIMVAILNPVITLINCDNEILAWELSPSSKERVDTVLAQSRQIKNIQREQALKEYKACIEKQMEALVKLIPEVNMVKCNAIFNLGTNQESRIQEKIEKVIVWVNIYAEKDVNESIKAVNPVKIDSYNRKENKESNNPRVDENVKNKIVSLIANYYSLSKDCIEIIFY